MDQKQFLAAMAEIAEEKGISQDQIIETLEIAIAAAYKKDYGKKGQNIKVKFDQKTGEIHIYQVFLVVDESMLREEPAASPEEQAGGPATIPPEADLGGEEVEEEGKVRFNPYKHIMVGEAKKIKKDAKPGDEIEIKLETHTDYGRIAAQTAKQVIIQRLREAEREVVFNEYRDKEGEVVSAIIQRIEGRNIFLDIGKATGVLFPEEQIPGEKFFIGQRLRVYILKVEQTAKGANIILSRAYPKLVSRLFAIEVPEISTGAVQIKSIAREPGSRTKIAVYSEEERVDPVGSCFPGKSLVLMEDFTYKPIVQLSKGEKVFTHLENQGLIIETYKRKWNGTLLKFRIFGIHKDIEVTKGHPLLFTDNYEGETKFTESSKIKNGYLAIPTLKKVIYDKTIHYFEKRKDFLWVLGMYLAEGSLDKARVNFTLSRKEKDKALKIKKTMEEYGGKVNINEPQSRNSILNVGLQGYYWEKIFKELGGQYCDGKKINARLMFLEPELQLEIFKGWRDGDGYFDKKRNRTIIVTTSEELLWQMYHILLRNNIRGNMQERKERGDRRPAYVLEVANNKTKDYRGFFKDSYYFSRIRSIEKVPRCSGRQVYNLEVNDDNSYIVHSIGVHNCVGQKGSRVQTVINELGGEKIDIIQWNENMAKYIANSLSPAKVLDVDTDEKKRIASAIVPEDQLSLAIGRKGQNVRLAAKLTGWKIDVKSDKAVVEESVVAKTKADKKKIKKTNAKKDVKKS